MYRQKINDFNAEQSKTDLEIMFSRGFFSGWYHGVNHKKLVEGKSSSHRGAKIGQVSKVIHRPNPSLIIETNQPIHKGDGLLILNTFDQPSASGKAYHVEKNGPKHLKIEFSNELSFQHVKQGDEVFINSSDFRDQQIKLSWRDKRLHKKIPISCQFSGKLNQALQLQVKCDDLELKLFSQSELSSAKKKPLQKSDLIEEFKKLAGTVYQLKELTCELDESLFIPAKELKQLRQQMTSSLDEHRLQRPNHNLYRPYAKVITTSKPPTLSKTQSSLHVLIREPDQINELNPKLVEKISLDFKHGTAYGPSIKKIKQMGIMAGIATTRILKENQTRRLNNLKKHQPDFILVRNLGALNFLHQNADLSHIPKIGDFSLNVTNHLSSFYLFNKGLDLICPSYDLNRQQLMTLLQNCTPNRYEITIHQYMPSFHMEHCVFATFLSDGTNAQNCGMVCRDHQVSLKDHKGIEHPLQADQECRNTMFNGKAQSAANLIPELLQLGVTNFRIEALNESSTDIATKLEHYQKVINGSLNPDILKNLLGLEEKYGISEGQLLNNRTYKDRKKTQ
jgi:putative protease